MIRGAKIGAWVGMAVVLLVVAALLQLRGRDGARSEGALPPTTLTDSSLASSTPVLGSSRRASLAPPTDTSSLPDERERERARKQLGYCVDSLHQRTRLLASKTAGFVAEKLPDEFRRLYPRECAELDAHPEAGLGELLAPPDEARWLALFEPEPVATVVLRHGQLDDFHDRLIGYTTVELEVLRGRRAPVSIHEHLAEFGPFVAEMFARPADLHALVAEYGAAVIDEDRGGPSDADLVELRIHELCWEARCRQENELIAGLPPDARFWLHLGRVMTRHIYDDSWWIAPDELAAVEEDYSDWLPPPR